MGNASRENQKTIAAKMTSPTATMIFV